jgi:hypothetical protein
VVRSSTIRRRAVVPIATLAVLMVPVTAAAQASAATTGYKLTRTTLGNGSKAVVRWNPCEKITYRVNLSAVRASRRSATAAQVRSAVGRTSSASGLVFSYRGTTSQVPQARMPARPAADLVIAVSTPSRTDLAIGGSTVGMGGTSWVTWAARSGSRTAYGSAVRYGFVVMDLTSWGRLKPGFGPGPSQGNALLHELGHAVGLRHAASSKQVMYPLLRAGTPKGYAGGDRAGLTKVGRAAGCITVPDGVG